MSDTVYELQITAEGALSCDGSACDDDCPIHGDTASEETDQ